ncbi:MAG: endonuclease/exonuclease/phosphatase family protein [Opitutales bacterium]
MHQKHPAPQKIFAGSFLRFSLKTILVCMLASAFLPATKTMAATPGMDDPETLAVMTFNLRFASPNPPHAWFQRRPVMQETIEKYSPDVIGTQEGLYQQLRNMDEDLPGYNWIGLGRAGGSRDEFMAVFYKTDRLEPLEFDHYWLSDTPSVIASITWDHHNKRMVTWVKFRDKKTDQEFYLKNTHFDHAVEQARVNASRLVMERINEWDTDLPILLIGDFNATPGTSETFDVLVNQSDFVDTWDEAEVRRGEGLNTFHGYREGPHEGERRIDWILSRGSVTSYETEIVTFKRDGQYPSDHFPVVTWLKIGE